MNIGQILWLVFNMLGLGVALAEHGKPKEGKENFVVTLIAFLLQFGFLWIGGFWR